MNSKEEIIVFDRLSFFEADIMNWYPIPATVICKDTPISLYKTRKILNKFKEQGLIKFERNIIWDEYDCENHFVCGWSLTQKGRENEIFKKHQKIVSNLIKEIWEEKEE